MSGGFSAGGLISGLDSNALIRQLMQLERLPAQRIESKIATLKQEKTALKDLRTQLTELRNVATDFNFSFSNVFNQFDASSSEETVLTATAAGDSPVIGSYTINVIKMASATVATSSGTLGSPINPGAALDSSGITASIEPGEFSINGEVFTIDPTTDTLNGILAQINASAAGVTATYDAATDRVTFANNTPGDTSVINFGGSDDTSNFLSVISVLQATQSTNAGGSTEVTATKNLGAVNASETLDAAAFANGAVTAGSFKINGVTITVDPTTDTLGDVLGRISSSDAGVSASYDSATDTIRIVSETLGSRTVGFQSGTSNFLDIMNLTTATQVAGSDSQFTINGGAVQTRNTNEVADAIGGVTLSLLSVGESTVTVSSDDDALIEGINDFVGKLNGVFDKISELTGVEGTLSNDGTLRLIEQYLRGTVMAQITGSGGTFQSLFDVGFSTGKEFDSKAVSHLELDEEEFREALRDDRSNVEALFTNSGGTGIANLLDDYLQSVTSTTGFLYQRVSSNGTIENQIKSMEDQIDRIDERIAMKEARMRKQFLQLEQLSSTYQSQGAALSGIGSGMIF